MYVAQYFCSMKQEIASEWWDMSNKEELTTKEIFYLTNEFVLYFTNGGS